MIIPEHEVVVRRSPRYFRFMILGGAIGVFVTFILTFSFPEQPDYSRAQVFGFVGAIAAAVGVLVGAVVAIVIDRISTRRARTFTMSAETVRVEEPLPVEAAAQTAEARQDALEPSSSGPSSSGPSSSEQSSSEQKSPGSTSSEEE